MPRKKAQPTTDVKGATVALDTAPVPSKDENTPDNDLIAEEIKIDDFCTAQAKAFAEFLKPHKERQKEIQAIILGRLLQRKVNSISGDAGTAYKSEILNVGIDVDNTEPYISEAAKVAAAAQGVEPAPILGRDAFLDFSLDHWEDFGQDGLLVSAQKDAVKKWIEQEGKPPPGIKISYFTRVNIRRS